MEFAKLYVPFILCFFIHLTGQTQNVFDTLNNFTPFSERSIELDSSYIVSSVVLGDSSQYAVALCKYDLSGNLMEIDTISSYPTETRAGRLCSNGNGFLLMNLVNNTPPFSSATRDITLTSYSSFSNINWSVTFGTNFQDGPSDLLIDGDKILALTTRQPTAVLEYGFHLLCFDTLGNFLWEKHYEGSGYDVAWDISKTDDNCYLLSGKTFIHPTVNTYGNYDIVVKKVDSLGNELWSTNIGLERDESGIANVVQLSDRTILVTGTISYNAPPYSKGVLAKIDLDGRIMHLNQRLYGENTGFYKSIENTDGTISVLGYKKDSLGVYETFIATYSPIIGLLWFKTYDIPFAQYHLCYDIIPTSDNGYFLVGTAIDSIQKSWLLKVNCMGDEDVIFPVQEYVSCNSYNCDQIAISSTFSCNDTIVYLSQGGLVSFYNSSPNTSSKLWSFGDGNNLYSGNSVIHIYTDTGIYNSSLTVNHGPCSNTTFQKIYVLDSDASLEEIDESALFEVFPNPSEGLITLRFNNDYSGSITCHNLIGQEVFKTEVSNIKEMKINMLESGIYLVKAKSNTGYSVVKKIRIF